MKRRKKRPAWDDLEKEFRGVVYRRYPAEELRYGYIDKCIAKESHDLKRTHAGHCARLSFRGSRVLCGPSSMLISQTILVPTVFCGTNYLAILQTGFFRQLISFH